MKSYNLPPLASSLTESIRDIGYSLNTAVADIIDNSISAEAKCVDIFSSIDKNSEIKFAIIDDGIGLPEKELVSAMRLGSQSPLVDRDLNDLGRFGLGMKTASFSQCRKLTVISSVEGKRSGAQWDLDWVSKTNKWDLQILNKNEIKDLFRIDKLSDNGTLVVWENCDRILDTTVKDSKVFYEKLESLENHLKLVFHRFFEKGQLKVRINDSDETLKYFDPFAEKYNATQRLPPEIVSINGENVYIQGFVLPHHSKVTPQEYEENAGEGGYLKNQGFYIYRNKRLIMHGTWFRIKPKSELAKLTRIRVDLPNSMDQEWKIDAMKSQASPPQSVRERIKKLIDQFFSKSTRVYTYKGKKKSNIAEAYWNRLTARGEINYIVNKDHPDIADFSKSLNKEQLDEFKLMLRDIALFFPTNMFFSDYGLKPGHFNKNPISDEDLEERALEHMKKTKKDFTKKDFINKYSTSEPYVQYTKSWDEFVDKNYG